MLSVDEALQEVSRHVRPLAARRRPTAEALGCTLAETVTSDVDSPPHDKSIVDGYALRFDDLTAGRAELRIVEEVTAGAVPSRTVEPGCATRIMTGAPLPAGADAVVMVERTSLPQTDVVAVDDPRLDRGRNIARRGTAMRRGETVLQPGDVGPLNPLHLGLLAEVGRTEVCVVPRPRTAILTTGNELVPASAVPGPGQIRNSNGPLLAALTARAGGVPHDLGTARDEPEDLRRKIAAGLKCDLLMLSGGVSAGVLDLAPGILRELGVVEVFHKVRVKPGKPLWFGTYAAADDRTVPVFGLPGNPVSGFVSFLLFVRRAFAILAGATKHDAVQHTAELAEAFEQRGDREAFWPCRTLDDGRVRPLAWHGSSDLRSLAAADGMIRFPAGDRRFAADERVTVHDV